MFYRNADQTYSKINWFFLIFDFTTCSTLVIPVAIVTLGRYFTTGEMTEDQWIRPFYFEWVQSQYSNPTPLQSDSESHFLFHVRRTFVRIDNICAYSIMIVVSALSIYAIGLGKLFVLELYLRGGFNIIACSKDLKNEIDNTDFIISELVLCIHFGSPSVIGNLFKILNHFICKHIPGIEMMLTFDCIYRIIWCTLCRFIKKFWSRFALIANKPTFARSKWN